MMANETKVSVAELVSRITAQIGMLQQQSESVNPFVSRGAQLALEWLVPVRDYIIAANKVLGSPCLKCGHWLKAGHVKRGTYWTCNSEVRADEWNGLADCGCVLYVADIIADYPEIARDMELVAVIAEPSTLRQPELIVVSDEDRKHPPLNRAPKGIGD